MHGQSSAKRRTFIKYSGIAVGTGILAGCSGADNGASGDDGDSETPMETTTDESGNEELEIGMILIDPEGGFWNIPHLNGLDYALEEENISANTSIVKGVAPSDVGQNLESYANQGVDIVFACSQTYSQQVQQIAPEYPETVFELMNGWVTQDPNVGSTHIKMEQPSYLAGIAAGLLTENNQLGWVGGVPIPQTFMRLNAFANGVQTVNSEATVNASRVGAFYDPPRERQIANTLLDQGVDVLATLTDSPAPVEAANNAGVWGIGMYAPQAQYGGDNYVTSIMPVWDQLYRNKLAALDGGEWSPEFQFHGFPEGGVELDDFGSQVPESVRSRVDEAKQQLIAGELDVFHDTQFEGMDSIELFKSMQEPVDNINIQEL
jgi:basic membrane protein A